MEKYTGECKICESTNNLYLIYGRCPKCDARKDNEQEPPKKYKLREGGAKVLVHYQKFETVELQSELKELFGKRLKGIIAFCKSNGMNKSAYYRWANHEMSEDCQTDFNKLMQTAIKGEMK
jgi:hypothetical protein